MHILQSFSTLLIFANTVSFTDCYLMDQVSYNKRFGGKDILTVHNVSLKKCKIECDIRRGCEAANYRRSGNTCELIGASDVNLVQHVVKEHSYLSISKSGLQQVGACGECEAVCDPITKDCIIKECQKHFVDKGSVEGNMLQVGSTIKVACNRYYRSDPLGGQLVCKAGSWEPFTQCVPDKVCNDVPIVFNAELQSHDGDRTPGTVLTYSCKDGYGSPANKNMYTVTCQQSQIWTDIGFECIKNCSDPKQITFATVNAGVTLEGAVRTYTCLNGYITISGSSIYVRCTNTGQWTTPTESCLKNCSNPPTKSHATVSTGTVYESSVRTYTCEPGYYVKKYGALTRFNTFNVTCEPSGTWGAHFECVSECAQSFALVTGTNGISDSRITGTSSYSYRYLPKYGRLDNDKAWAPDDEAITEYIQYDFVGVKIVKQITTQGLEYEVHYEYVKLYQLHYSTDCIGFVKYNKQFEGNTDAFSHASNTIDPPILARCIRVHALDWNEWITLRVEFYGC